MGNTVPSRLGTTMGMGILKVCCVVCVAMSFYHHQHFLFLHNFSLGNEKKGEYAPNFIVLLLLCCLKIMLINHVLLIVMNEDYYITPLKLFYKVCLFMSEQNRY